MLKYILIMMLLAAAPAYAEEAGLPFVTGAKDIGAFDFTLTGSDGKPHDSREWRGKFVLLYFGFTHCPDICPAGLAQLTATLQMLGEDAGKIQPVFITVDPVRDTPDRLKIFMESFHPAILPLTGDQDSIDAVTDAYGIVVRKREAKEGISYDYTADTILLNREGEMVGYFPYGISAAQMAEQLKAEWLH